MRSKATLRAVDCHMTALMTLFSSLRLKKTWPEAALLWPETSPSTQTWGRATSRAVLTISVTSETV